VLVLDVHIKAVAITLKVVGWAAADKALALHLLGDLRALVTQLAKGVDDDAKDDVEADQGHHDEEEKVVHVVQEEEPGGVVALQRLCSDKASALAAGDAPLDGADVALEQRAAPGAPLCGEVHWKRGERADEYDASELKI
jgi:hypothetical protein